MTSSVAKQYLLACLMLKGGFDLFKQIKRIKIPFDLRVNFPMAKISTARKK